MSIGKISNLHYPHFSKIVSDKPADFFPQKQSPCGKQKLRESPSIDILGDLRNNGAVILSGSGLKPISFSESFKPTS